VNVLESFTVLLSAALQARSMGAFRSFRGVYRSHDGDELQRLSEVVVKSDKVDESSTFINVSLRLARNRLE
jgi:hypothetical protein